MQCDTAKIGEDHAAVGVQADKRYVLAQTVKQGIQRHQRQYGREHLENQHPFQQRRFARETHAGEGISTGGGKRHDTNGGNTCDFHRVPQPQQDRERRRRDAAIRVFHAEAQREPPVLPGDFVRDQAPRREVTRTQGDGDNHQQREHDRRDENQQA